MAAQVEVKLKGMSDAGVHCRPCRNIPTLPNLSKEEAGLQWSIKCKQICFMSTICVNNRNAHSFRLVSTEESCVVTFLHHDVGDAWLIVFL